MNQSRLEPAATRERILDAAGQVFARKGYQAASLDEVAQSAGMTKGAIYWHFRSKSDLFFALLDHKFQINIAPVPEDLRHAIAADNPQEAMTRMLQNSFSRLREDRDWPRLYLEFIGQARDNDMRLRLASFHEQSLTQISSIVAAMQQVRLAPPRHDARTLAVFWSALFDGLMLAWIINPDTDQNALVAQIVDLLWCGIDPDAQPKAPAAERIPS